MLRLFILNWRIHLIKSRLKRLHKRLDRVKARKELLQRLWDINYR